MVIPFGAPSHIKHYKIMATKNQYTTLVSVRLDNDVLVNLNKAQQHLRYHTRSNIINNILGCVLTCTDSKTLSDIVHFNKYGILKGKITFEKDI